MDMLLLLLLLLPGCLFALSDPLVVEVSVNEKAIIQCGAKISKATKYSVTWSITDQNGDPQRIMSYSEKGGQIDPGTDYSNKIEMATDFSLVIKEARLSDDRTFTCKVSSDTEGSREETISLKVFDPPEVPELSITTNMLSVTIAEASKIGTCVSRNSYPAPVIKWYKNNMLLNPASEANNDLYMTSRTVTEASGLYTVSSVLFLRPTKADKDSFFSCKVVYQLPGGGQDSLESERFNLTLHYYPEVVQFEVVSLLPIKEGDTVTLRCVADGYPPPFYSITKMQDGKELELYSGTEGTVTFDPISRNDNGSYHCVAVDFDSPSDATLETEIDINVHYLNELSIIPANPITVALGEDVPLSCLGDGSDDPEMLWKKGNKVIAKNSRHRLREVSYADSGVYTCEATVPSVPGLRKEQNIMITVEGKAQIESGNDVFEVPVEGVSVTVSCLATGYPQPQIIWIPESLKGTQYVSGLQVYSNVSFPVTSKLINGVYCTAKNDIGTTQKQITLRILSLVSPTNAPNKEQQSGGSSTAVIAVVVCVLLLLLVVAFFYFLRKKGRLTCGRSEKQQLPQDPAASKLSVELKSDERTDQHGLLGSHGGGGSAEC